LQLNLKGKDWDKVGEKPLITFVSCPKKFPSQKQILGLLTWLTLDPQPEIIYISDDPGVAETCRDFGIKNIAPVKKNEYGTPLLDFIFMEAQKQAKGEIIVFLNTDILTLQNFMDILLYVVKISSKLDNFMVIGPRQDTDLEDEFYTFDDTWHSRFREKHMKPGQWTSGTALDYFIFKKGFFPEFPAMAIGRFVWDTWIMAYALRSKYPVINGNQRITAFHVNHHYEIKGLPSDGLNNAPLATKENSPEFKENIRLAEEWGGWKGGELQCSEYLISKCSSQLCIIPNKDARVMEFCEHDNWDKIDTKKLQELRVDR